MIVYWDHNGCEEDLLPNYMINTMINSVQFKSTELNKTGKHSKKYQQHLCVGSNYITGDAIINIPSATKLANFELY